MSAEYAETVSIGKDGTLYLPDSQGRIWTAQNGGQGKLQELAYVGGKPLGGHVYPNGDAIFCDAVKVTSNASDAAFSILCHSCLLESTRWSTWRLHLLHSEVSVPAAIVVSTSRVLNTCKGHNT